MSIDSRVDEFLKLKGIECSKEQRDQLIALERQLDDDRRPYGEKALRGEINGREFANAINTLAATYAKRTAEILGIDHERLFGAPVGQVAIADPDIAEAAYAPYQRAKRSP